ncbi:MAG: glycosyltransferase family 2 protein [Prolixibacteraceae bacterium]|nr:glycosyltransferase family 2 protein [Prolixibacteraceae bacterium]
MQDLVSVLIPCYNCEYYIENSILSIFNQTYSNLEIVIIDDCSTDKTYEILENLSHLDNRIKLYRNEENKKLIYTLNRGIDLCNGKYIARMDADDISTPNRIEKQVQAIIAYNVDIIASQIWFINSDSIVIGKSMFINSGTLSSLYISFFQVPFVHPSVLLKTSLLKENKYSNKEENLHIEDLELWHRLLKKNYRARLIEDRLLYYRINKESVSRKFANLQLKNQTQHILNAINRSNVFYIDEKIISYIMRLELPDDGKYKLNDIIKQIRNFESQFILQNTCNMNSNNDLSEITNWTDLFIGKYLIYLLIHSNIDYKLNSLSTFLMNPKLLINKTNFIFFYNLLQMKLIRKTIIN